MMLCSVLQAVSRPLGCADTRPIWEHLQEGAAATDVDTYCVQALAYRERITAAIPDGSGFTPLMTMYLTDGTPPEVRRRCSGTPA